jgi:PAS domain S-box-containing protein
MAPKPVENDAQTVNHCLRDVVALATLPAMWSGPDLLRIAESLASSLFTILDPEFVYVFFTERPGTPSLAVAQTDRYQTSPSLADRMGPAIVDWAFVHDPDEILLLLNPMGSGKLRIATRPLGCHAELGVIAAAFRDDNTPTPMHHLALNVGASQVATAIQNAHLLRALRESEERVHHTNVELAKRVTELQKANVEIESARRAALNVMDDAVRARQAVESLNKELRGEITERKRTEEQFIQSQKTLFDLVERAPFGIYIVDSRFRIMQMNAGSQTGAFRNVQPVIGRDFAEAMCILWPEPVAADVIAVFRHTLETGEPYYSPRFTHPRHDAEAVESYEWELHRMTLPDGQYGVVCYYFDSTRLRETEAAVSYRAEQFETLLNQAPLGVYVVDADFTIRQVNPTARPVFGDIPNLIGRDFDEVIHILWTKDYADEIVRIFRHTLETGEPYETSEHTEYRIDRNVIEYYEWRVDRIELPNGRYGVVCYFRDISARVLARETIAESEERFRALVHASAQIVWTMNADGEAVEDSPSWRAFTGQSYEQWKGHGWLDVLHPEDRERVAAIWQKAVMDNTPVGTTYRIRHATGEWRWTAVRAVPLLNTDGSVHGWVGMNTDFTERKRAEEALRQYDERFDLVAEGAEVGFWFCDLPFDTLIWDARVKEHFWLAAEAIVTIDMFYERLHPDDRERVRQAIAGSIDNKARYDIHYRTVSPEGDEKWIRAIGRTFYDDAGRPKRFDGVTLDVTQSKRAEEGIRRLLEEAQAREHELRDKQQQLVQASKLASIGELASGVAHELNNPLNNIGLFIGNALDQLEDGPIDLPRLRRTLEATVQQVKKSADIITHLRIFARTSVKQSEPVDMHAVIRSAASLVEAQLRLRNVHLSLELCPGRPIVLGNAIQLEQVLINLLTNARDAVERVADKCITIRSAIGDAHVDVMVRDTGAGISPEHQGRIFDPFFTTKDVGKGTGLGLSISYGIIHEHQGWITVESESEKGTTFTIHLPLASDRSQS